MVCTDRCVECEHPITAATPEAKQQAIQDHVEYVNRCLDRETDIHFALSRLTLLVGVPQ